ncbi:hypothetical protein AALP_AA5G005900 [Arabis alpina]|uniref:H15 domain-containing protein n=1 Tax=Arabis alpina TaxID=50452 RepID=A0A087GU30_ARAAL|nr:hypothetical protein AALP_AA5G005900 [Arabis alpina]
MENDLVTQQAPMAETQQLPFNLPPYPQMIMEAIEVCNDANGINKTAIAKHIESAQVTLPPSHTTLLNYHLNQMKQSGQIVQVKNNFMKPNPDAPPKRGRGRPPKAKPQGGDSSEVVVTVPDLSVSPRGRGRPPKSEAAKAEAVKVKEPPRVSGRGRGRPPKKAKIDSETVEEVKTESETVEAETVPPNGERRGRGRPPKVKPVMVPVGC